MDTKVVPAGWHYLPCKLNEVMVFLRRGHLFPTAAPALSVAALDEQNLKVYAFGDGSYQLYQDDGVSKDFANPEHLKTIKVTDGTVSADGLNLSLR